MVQRYTQQDRGSKGGWASNLGSGRAETGRPFSGTIFYSNEAFLCSYSRGVANDQWTGINRFYYLRDFTDMRCKHSRVLSIIREQLHREPSDGDVFIVMSRDRRIVRLFTYDNRSYTLFEKKFVAGHQFMKVDHNGDERVYRIDWKDVVLLLENPIVSTLKIK